MQHWLLRFVINRFQAFDYRVWEDRDQPLIEPMPNPDVFRKFEVAVAFAKRVAKERQRPFVIMRSLNIGRLPLFWMRAVNANGSFQTFKFWTVYPEGRVERDDLPEDLQSLAEEMIE